MAAIDADFWETRFREGRTPWERGELNPGYLAWRDSGDLTPRRILVPGAGRSPEPEAMLADGFDVTALDLSPAAIETQAERLGPERAILADVTLWRPDRPFDAIYDQTCLCALPPALWPAYEASLREWLAPGGRLFILFMQSEREGGPPFNCPIPEMRELFSAWNWPESLPPAYPHGLGTIEQPAILTR